jgi:hypothetical protein
MRPLHFHFFIDITIDPTLLGSLFVSYRCNCATPKATWELNGGIRSLRSRFCTERYSDARYLNPEFSPTRYRDVVLTSWDRDLSDCKYDPSATARWHEHMRPR